MTASATSMFLGLEQRLNWGRQWHFWGVSTPLSNQIIMNAERPKFQGTAENVSEFPRKCKEYHRLINGNSPTTNEGQILHLFQQCLDEATALQLKREIEENPHLTVGNFMAIMEKDFVKDFSAQARYECRQIKLTNWSKNQYQSKNGEPSKYSGRWKQ